jgi:predicted DNA-binding transcriptional regulator YafY
VAEIKLLIDAIQSSKFITEKKSNELIKKIKGLLSHHQAAKLQRQVFVHGRIKTMNESIYYTVDDIHEAINSNSKISFQYFDWNVEKQKVLRHDGKIYRVSPFALTWDDENYYLIAYDSENEQIRHYRVDKMQKIKVLDERRDGAERFRDFDMAQYSKKTFGMFRGKEELVTLRCKNKLASIIIDRFGRETQFFKVDDEHFEIHERVAISPLFLTWVLNFGADIEIVSPGSVRAEFAKLLRETLERYEN